MTEFMDDEGQHKRKPYSKCKRDKLVESGDGKDIPDIIYCCGGRLHDNIVLKRVQEHDNHRNGYHNDKDNAKSTV